MRIETGKALVMAKITFYPVGNADSSLTEFNDDRLLLIDYYQRSDEDDKDKRIDLEEELRKTLKKRDSFDVVAFTHADSDHCLGSEDFFWLEHTDKYQDDERIKIEDLWVPACFVTETGMQGSAKVIRQEARHRLKEGKGVHVFGQPDSLDDWFKENDIDPKSRRSLIWTAGKCIPTFSKSNGEAEVFVHSPFAFRMEDDEQDRNNASIVLHISFFEGDKIIRAMYGADAEHEAWSDIVNITKRKKRQDRLIWDIFGISHHCSYTALGPEKGKEKTVPVDNVKYLFNLGGDKSYIISSSEPIPDKDSIMPPHKQAAAYYEEVADNKSGDFLVTMEKPTVNNPKPLVFDITDKGAGWKKVTGVVAGIPAVVASASPRQG